MSDVTQISGNQIKAGAILNINISASASIDYTKINFTGAPPSIIGAETALTFTSPLIRTVDTITLGVVPVNLGGTGIASLVDKRLFYGGNAGVYAQSANLIWDHANNRLGINTGTPAYSIDVAGSVRCDGQFIGVLNGTSYFTQGLKNTNGDEIDLSSFTVPSAGQVLVATSDVAANWADSSTLLPDQTAHTGEVLTTDGASLSWSAIPEELPAMSLGTKGQFLSNDGAVADWVTVGLRSVASNDTTLNLAEGDSWAVVTNQGDADGSVVNLPTAASGINYTIYVQTAQTITITANTGDTIRIDAAVTAAAGSIASNVVGSSITLLAINDTEWVATSVVGTWTI